MVRTASIALTVWLALAGGSLLAQSVCDSLDYARMGNPGYNGCNVESACWNCAGTRSTGTIGCNTELE